MTPKDFEELESGDLIQHKRTKTVYLVAVMADGTKNAINVTQLGHHATWDLLDKAHYNLSAEVISADEDLGT